MILVTGSSGYIGSHLMTKLPDAVGVDNAGKPDLKLDLTYDPLRFPKVESIVHLAALTGEVACTSDVCLAMLSNVLATDRLLDYAANHLIQKIIFASSQVVYGNKAPFPFVEDFPLEIAGTYARTKAIGERLIGDYEPHVILRIASVYGFGTFARWGSVTGKFVRLALAGNDLPVWGTGQQIVDFIHVDDVYNAIIKALKYEGSGTFNIGSGIGTTINELADVVIKCAERRDISIQKTYPKPERKEVDRVLWIKKAERKLGWQPKMTLEAGIEDLFRRAEDAPYLIYDD